MTVVSYPGVYPEIQEGLPSTPVGTSASTMAVTGFTLEGPLGSDKNGLPVVTSFKEAVDMFGSFNTKSKTMHAIFNFFQNGGQFVRVNRVVGAGATKSIGTFAGLRSEALVTNPMPDGVATSLVFSASVSDQLTHIPVVPTTVSIEDTDGIIFTDDGNGLLVSTTAGCSGMIDYITGEGVLNYNIPAAPPGIGVTFTATYQYKTFEFEMLWPGLVGDDFRVVIQGDQVYFDQSTASFSKFNVLIEQYNSTTSTYDIIENYSGISLTDPLDAKYIATVINDSISGSQKVVCVPKGHNEKPIGIDGVLVTGEAIVPVPVYDGSERAFTYLLANSINPMSLSVGFIPNVIGEIVGTPAGGGASYSGTLDVPPELAAPNTVEILVELSDASVESYVNSGAVGVLVGSAAGVGTIDALGAFTVTPDVETINATPVVAHYKWASSIIVTDDGIGNLSLTGGLGIWSLDTNGVNTIDYDTRVLSITWKYISNPSVGPAAAHPVLAGIAWSSLADYYAQPLYDNVNLDLTGGLDGASLTRLDLTGAAALANATGLFALNKLDDILLVCVPDFETDYMTIGDIIDYCTSRVDRYFPFSVPEGLDPNQAVSWKRTYINKNVKEALCLYPHVKMSDPVTGITVNFPPSSHWCGIAARTWNQANPSQVPAGIDYGAIKYAVGLERDLTDLQVGYLNQNNIDCLIQWPNTGRVMWGARNLEVNGEYPYVSQTMTTFVVLKTLQRLLYRYVFQRNTDSLRSRIKMNCESTLLGLYNSSYFAGATPKESYYVICDRTNNIEMTIKQGFVFIDVGIATTTPGEFIVIRLKQKLITQS